MEQLNRTLRNPARIRFESARLDLYWEAGSRAFEAARGDAEAARAILRRIARQTSSGRTFNARLMELACAPDLQVTFF